MIELRWLTAMRKHHDPFEPGGYNALTEVLQYRIHKRLLHRALDGWSEWKDVPREIDSGVVNQ